MGFFSPLSPLCCRLSGCVGFVRPRPAPTIIVVWVRSLSGGGRVRVRIWRAGVGPALVSGALSSGAAASPPLRLLCRGRTSVAVVRFANKAMKKNMKINSFAHGVCVSFKAFRGSYPRTPAWVFNDTVKQEYKKTCTLVKITLCII